MDAFDYSEAHKLAVREYRRAMSAGESPYPACLDEQLSPPMLAEGKRIGREQIPLALVVGTKTEGRNHAFARNFMPLLGIDSEFATKWRSLCQSHLEEGIRQPIKVYEYRNRFYVEEGNKRVSILKYFDADSIEADVIQIPSRQTGADDPDAEAARSYDAFLRFFSNSRMRTVEFSEPESYRRLQQMVKHTAEAEQDQTGDEQVWTEDEQVWTED